jgi:hypothetical protein
MATSAYGLTKSNAVEYPLPLSPRELTGRIE